MKAVKRQGWTRSKHSGCLTLFPGLEWGLAEASEIDIGTPLGKVGSPFSQPITSLGLMGSSLPSTVAFLRLLFKLWFLTVNSRVIIPYIYRICTFITVYFIVNTYFSCPATNPPVGNKMSILILI